MIRRRSGKSPAASTSSTRLTIRKDFPSGFGADNKLFTDDDPLVRLPAGYTVVNMDTTPFTFDRSRNP